MNTVQLFRGASIYPWQRKYYWRVVSDNGQIVASSEAYYSKWNAKRAARKLYPEVKIVDVS